jgi:hypothetical protein
MTDVPANWILIEAAKRCGWSIHIPSLQRDYQSNEIFRALCDMTAKHESSPPDRKLLCAREAVRNKGQNKVWSKEEVAIRAIELWEEGFGK